MIVKENISFQRGLDPKKALDVGLRRSGNIRNFVERGLEDFLIMYKPKTYYRRNDGSECWVSFYDKGLYKINEYCACIKVNRVYWDTIYTKSFKDKVNEWFETNDFKIISFKYVSKYSSYEVAFDDK